MRQFVGAISAGVVLVSSLAIAASPAAAAGCQSKLGGKELFLQTAVAGSAFTASGPSSLGCTKLHGIVVKLAPVLQPGKTSSRSVSPYRCSVLGVIGICRIQGASSKTVVVRRL